MTRLSELQYPMLQHFVDKGYGTYHMSVEEAQTFDQRPFRSLLIRKWVSYNRRGFFLTKDGARAWNEFHTRSIIRKDPSMPLTAYFDAKHYGLHVIRKRSAA